MSKPKPLFTEATDVPASKSIAEIFTLLVQAGAVSINQNLESGKMVSVSFVLPYGGQRIPYSLPARVDPVFHALNGRRDVRGQFARSKMAEKDREQAERVAWRQVYWWLKAQLALIQLGMVEAGEVLMPYAIGNDGRTFWETYKVKMLAAPKSDTAS